MSRNQAPNCSSGSSLYFWAASCSSTSSSMTLFSWGQREGQDARQVWVGVLLFRVHVDLIALGSSWSRTCCALEKAGWSTVKVQMREMFPPGRVCSVDFFRPPSVPCCRARILHASGRCNVKSASYWVGQGGTSSQRHQHESPGD